MLLVTAKVTYSTDETWWRRNQTMAWTIASLAFSGGTISHGDETMTTILNRFLGEDHLRSFKRLSLFTGEWVTEFDFESL